MAEVVSTGVSHMCDNSTVSVKAMRPPGQECPQLLAITIIILQHNSNYICLCKKLQLSQ